MNKILGTTAYALFAMAFVWLLYSGVEKPTGAVLAGILLVCTVLALVFQRKMKVPTEKDLPLLLILIILIGGIVALFSAGNRSVLVPFGALLCAGGVLSLVQWLSDKDNRKKTGARLWKEDLRLTKAFDLGFIIFLAFLEKGGGVNPLFWIILCLVIVDVVRHVVNGRAG